MIGYLVRNMLYSILSSNISTVRLISPRLSGKYNDWDGTLFILRHIDALDVSIAFLHRRLCYNTLNQDLAESARLSKLLTSSEVLQLECSNNHLEESEAQDRIGSC